jgi:glycosyltransferase involved in cell wall biosynthesis
MKISVCIPTYNRLHVLKEAVSSCLQQTHLPNEILIGDDSSTEDTERWIKNTQADMPVAIRYFRNRPSLKQAANVNELFKNTKTELLVLLHDDDTLLPNAIASLYACFTKQPDLDAAFGKQYLMSDAGVINKTASVKLNEIFFRTAAYEGTRLTPLETGFLQQFPNDGFMIKTVVAREIGYTEEAGDACDFDFALRVGMRNSKLYFLNEFTASYRFSNDAINKKSTNNAGILSFYIVEKLDVPAASLPHKIRWLENKAPVAIADATNLRWYKNALQIYFSRWHRNKIFTLGGIKRFLFILAVPLKGILKKAHS